MPFQLSRTAPIRALDTVGDQAVFYAKVVGSIPTATTRYRREIVRLIAELGTGTGALAMVGGSAFIVASITFFAGAVAAAQGFDSSSSIGVSSLSPMLAA